MVIVAARYDRHAGREPDALCGKAGKVIQDLPVGGAGAVFVRLRIHVLEVKIEQIDQGHKRGDTVPGEEAARLNSYVEFGRLEARQEP